MCDLTDGEFVDFIKYHKKFFKKVEDISKNDYGKPLIPNNDFKL